MFTFKNEQHHVHFLYLYHDCTWHIRYATYQSKLKSVKYFIIQYFPSFPLSFTDENIIKLFPRKSSCLSFANTTNKMSHVQLIRPKIKMYTKNDNSKINTVSIFPFVESYVFPIVFFNFKHN